MSVHPTPPSPDAARKVLPVMEIIWNSKSTDWRKESEKKTKSKPSPHKIHTNRSIRIGNSVLIITIAHGEHIGAERGSALSIDLKQPLQKRLISQIVLTRGGIVPGSDTNEGEREVREEKIGIDRGIRRKPAASKLDVLGVKGSLNSRFVLVIVANGLKNGVRKKEGTRGKGKRKERKWTLTILQSTPGKKSLAKSSVSESE